MPWYAFILTPTLLTFGFLFFCIVDMAVDFRMSDRILANRARRKDRKREKKMGISQWYVSNPTLSGSQNYFYPGWYTLSSSGMITDRGTMPMGPMPEIDEPATRKINEQFEGKEIEFGLGSVMGTRSFRILTDGTLTGVAYEYPWQLGINEAQCYASAGGTNPQYYKLLEYDQWLTEKIYTYIATNRFKIAPKGSPEAYWVPKDVTYPSPSGLIETYRLATDEDPVYVDLLAQKKECERRMGVLDERFATFKREKHSLDDCTHGYYAYYEGSNNYFEPGMVMGVVRGTGELVIGTKGFKAEKAEIMALHIPSSVPGDLAIRVMKRYEGIPILNTFEELVAEFPPTGDID